MENNYTYKRALDLAEQVGKLMGAIGYSIKYGDEMSNDVFRSLARSYIEVAGDNSWNADDVARIRSEAVRRGVDIG